MHGAAHGQNQVADILGDADVAACFLTDRQGSGGGLGGKGGDGRGDNVLQLLDAQLAAGKQCVQGEENQNVQQARG